MSQWGPEGCRGCDVLVVGGTEHLGRAGWIAGTLDSFHFNPKVEKRRCRELSRGWHLQKGQRFRQILTSGLPEKEMELSCCYFHFRTQPGPSSFRAASPGPQ